MVIILALKPKYVGWNFGNRPPPPLPLPPQKSVYIFEWFNI